MDKITIKNAYINLTNHKTYRNEDGNTISELVYTSYVSEFGFNRIMGIAFIDKLSFGYAIGFDKEGKSIIDTARIQNSSKLYLYYAKYDVTEINIQIFGTDWKEVDITNNNYEVEKDDSKVVLIECEAYSISSNVRKTVNIQKANNQEEQQTGEQQG